MSIMVLPKVNHRQGECLKRSPTPTSITCAGGTWDLQYRYLSVPSGGGRRPFLTTCLVFEKGTRNLVARGHAVCSFADQFTYHDYMLYSGKEPKGPLFRGGASIARDRAMRALERGANCFPVKGQHISVLDKVRKTFGIVVDLKWLGEFCSQG